MISKFLSHIPEDLCSTEFDSSSQLTAILDLNTSGALASALRWDLGNTEHASYLKQCIITHTDMFMSSNRHQGLPEAPYIPMVLLDPVRPSPDAPIPVRLAPAP